MTLWVLGFAVLCAAGGLRVETGTPAALCPDIGEVRRSVRDRISVDGPGEWVASYDLVHRPGAASGDVVRIELRDPAGRLRLQRELPRSGESCVALAQAVSLVLETYFRHPAEHAADVETVAPPADAGARAAPPTGPPALGSGPIVDLVGGWALGPSAPALALDLWYGGRSSSPWAAGVEGVWLPSAQNAPIDFGSDPPGTGTVHGLLFRGWVARRLRVAEPAEALLGPELVLGVDRIETSGVPGGTSNDRAAAGAGVRGHLRLRLAGPVTLSLIAAADYTPRALAGRFEIVGLPGEFFPAPQLRLFLGAGLGVAPFQ
jgi:hypothetical protein